MKRVEVSGRMNGQTTHFHRVKLEKVERVCGECGRKTVPEGTPDEIVVSIKKGVEVKGE